MPYNIHPRHTRQAAPRYPRSGLAIAFLLALSTATLHAGEPTAPPGVTTLPTDSTVTVDLRGAQQDAEREAARQRALTAAKLPHAEARAALVPEFLLIQREVLADLPVASSHPDGPKQTWRLRSVSPPELFAQRLIARFLRAGFSTAKSCTGEEWSATHGANRVALRLETRVVAVVLAPATLPCPATP